MRTSTLLVLFGCIIAASFASYAVKKNPTFKFDASALNTDKIEKKASFGDLVNLFQTHDFQDNSKLHEFLDKLKQRIHEEHEEHFTIYTNQKAACTEEVNFRNQEISDAQSSRSAAEAHKSLCESEKSEAEGLKSLAEQAIVVYEQQIVDLDASRALQYALYLERKGKLASVHDHINTALDYLDELEMEANTLGLGATSQLIQITNALLSASVALKQTNTVLPVYNKLLQVHNKQSFQINDVYEVRDMIIQIRTNVENSQSALELQESNDLLAYQETRANLEALVAKLRVQVELSQAYIDKMDSCIESEEAVISMSNDKETRNGELLTYAEALCQDNENEWTQAEAARHHQLNLIDQLKWALDQLAAEFQDSLLEGAVNIEEIIGS